MGGDNRAFYPSLAVWLSSVFHCAIGTLRGTLYCLVFFIVSVCSAVELLGFKQLEVEVSYPKHSLSDCLIETGYFT
jgi:hypothetical protein